MTPCIKEPLTKLFYAQMNLAESVDEIASCIAYVSTEFNCDIRASFEGFELDLEPVTDEIIKNTTSLQLEAMLIAVIGHCDGVKELLNVVGYFGNVYRCDIYSTAEGFKVQKKVEVTRE
ncbi:hypothetical protein BCU71_06275 [Vibrio lentus]|uniref:hypothetical protein n=1 Tax=Vibrio lentus TaxID=136468 RepID=UPI000C863B28|nr:hypothetical protein [Vibrio lentus]PMH28173.1 hypothetical protein BCU71_06275 [Vibrio lentus]PMK70155.1 hypothetical protein BCT93_05910 [Vibrio lentus]